MLFHSCILGLVALGAVVAVDEVDLLAVGHRDERSTVGELHGGGFRVVERRPVRQSLAVGIERLGEVHPVLLEDFSDGSLSRILVGLCQKMAVEIHDIVGMGHTATTGILLEAHLGRLSEIGGIDGALAGLGLQAYPGKRRPRKTHITESIAKAVPSFVVGVAGVYLQGLVSPTAKYLPNGFLIVFDLDVAGREECTLVRVRHYNNGYIIIFSALVETVLVVADNIAVDAGPETGKAYVAVTKFHCSHLTHLLDILFLKMLLES